MNERDKELAMQAGFNPFDTECYEGLDVLIDLIRADEREANAKVCDAYGKMGLGANSAANAIRARGNK